MAVTFERCLFMKCDVGSLHCSLHIHILREPISIEDKTREGNNNHSEVLMGPSLNPCDLQDQQFEGRVYIEVFCPF